MDQQNVPKKPKKKVNLDQRVVKYVAPAIVLGIGLFVGGMVMQGVYVGLLTTAGFWLLLEKCKVHYPGFYNWMLDHAVEADFLVSFVAVLGLGMSVTGIIAGAVVNLLSSIVLDYYGDYVGKVDGVESTSIKTVWSSVKNKFGFGDKEEVNDFEVIEYKEAV